MARLRHKPEHPLADKDGWVELNDDYYNYLPCASDEKSKNINVISDIMPETRHMATGRYFVSKSEFRKETKASGCIEVGNDSSIMNPKPRKRVELSKEQRVEHIKHALHEARNKR